MSLVLELQNIGLSDKEAKVYIAGLELGQASVQNISKRANVNRATTYSVLNSLIKKGLCSTFEEGKKIRFVAINPENLTALFELQKKEIEEKEKHFEGVLKDLKLMHNKGGQQSVVKFYDGKEGLLSCSREFLAEYKQASKEPVRLFYPRDRLKELFSDEDLEKFKKIRLKKNVRSKSIYRDAKGEYPSNTEGTRINLVNNNYPITADFAVYGDYVRISSLGDELSGVLIKDKEIARTMKSMFDLCWEEAKRLNERKGAL